MKIAEIMTHDPEWIRPETSVEDAACKMRELDAGFIPIGDGQRLQGILTDRDIVIRAVYSPTATSSSALLPEDWTPPPAPWKT